MTEPSLHICRAVATRKWFQRGHCPTCGKVRWFMRVHEEWYGVRETCLKCGEQWGEGEMLERPFAPRWRKKNVEMAKREYRRWKARKCDA